jgi:hypothetical protein
VITGAVGQIIVDEGRLCPLQAGGLFLLHSNDGLEILWTGNGTCQFRKLDVNALGRLEIEIVVQSVRNGVPGNGNPAISALGCHVCRCRRQFLFFDDRITGAPFSMSAFHGQRRTIESKHLIQQPCFDHRWCLLIPRQGYNQETWNFQ